MSRRSYGMNIRVGYKLYTERESKKWENLCQIFFFFCSNFGRKFQKSWISKPSHPLKNSRNIKPETPKKLKKKEKKKTTKSLKIENLRKCFFEPAVSLERRKNLLVNFGKFFISL